MADAPVEAGAVQATVSRSGPVPVNRTSVGWPGRSLGELEVSFQLLSPALLEALTQRRYEWVLARPLMVVEVFEVLRTVQVPIVLGVGQVKALAL